jgi:uncharacterized damage-inducible protein DinB
LTGCVGRGTTKEGAITKVRETLRDYLALLRQHGEAMLPASEPIELDVEETDSTSFPPDYVPLTSDELATLFRRMDISRQELMKLIESLPPEVIEWKPNEESWAIRNALAHIANADLWYLSRLEEVPRDPLARLPDARQRVIDGLRSLSGKELGRVNWRDGEEWTPRKVARRVLEHEQEHIDHIRQLIARYQEAHG